MTKASVALFQNEYQFPGQRVQSVINIHLYRLHILTRQAFTFNFGKSHSCQKTLLLLIIFIPDPANTDKTDCSRIF